MGRLLLTVLPVTWLQQTLPTLPQSGKQLQTPGPQNSLSHLRCRSTRCSASSSAALSLPELGVSRLAGLGFSSICRRTYFFLSPPLTTFPFPTLV